MLATIAAATLLGVEGRPVVVEVHVGPGLPGFTVVGLPDASCREARDRVRAALVETGAHWPSRRITVNLAPSGLRKAGSVLDLAIAVGLLVAAEQLPAGCADGLAFLGELGLDGRLRTVPGILPLVDAVTCSTVIVPAAGAAEARLVGRHQVRCASTMAEVVGALGRGDPWPDPPAQPPAPDRSRLPDLADVRGQPAARRALEVAAAGGHHLLMVGPPGAGKTTLAHRLPSILPPLDDDTALEATRVHSAAGAPLPPGGLVRRPPFRAPHHSASSAALVGGGTSRLQPGEISLAHGGVLFLDELGEFSVDVLDALRTPLEEGVVRVARATAKVCFPARFLLVGAMNPCPCGWATTPGACRCSAAGLARYGRRLSGPLLDRFDLRIVVDPADPVVLVRGGPGEPSSAVAERVARARTAARLRGVEANAALGGAALEEHAPLSAAATDLLEGLLRAGRLSPRGLRRVRSVALTLADLDGRRPPLAAEDVSLAARLRQEPGFATRRLAGVVDLP